MNMSWIVFTYPMTLGGGCVAEIEGVAEYDAKHDSVEQIRVDIIGGKREDYCLCGSGNALEIALYDDIRKYLMNDKKTRELMDEAQADYEDDCAALFPLRHGLKVA